MDQIFKGLPQCMIEATHTPYAAIHVMLEDIAQALKACHIGVTYYLFHPDMQTDFYSFLIKELTHYKNPRFLFDVNGKSNPEMRRAGEGQHLLDRLGIRQVTFLTDNPCHMHGYLRHGSENGILLYVDRDFEPMLKAMELPYRDIIFFPHGSPDIAAPAAPLPERPIECLFIGNIKRLPCFSEWLSDHQIHDPLVAKALEQAVERVLQEREPVFQSLYAALQDSGLELAGPAILEICAALEGYIHSKRRMDVLMGIHKHQLTICGEIDRDVGLPHDDHHVLGPVLFREALDLIGNSRFLINISTTFRNGGHERVFYGMNRGTVILNDWSRYLEPEAEAGLGLAFLPDDTRDMDVFLAQQKAGLAVWEERRKDSIKSCIHRHGWRQRLAPVLNLILDTP